MATATETWAPEAEVVLPRKCNYCDRRFRKVEHLKRHERSREWKQAKESSNSTD